MKRLAQIVPLFGLFFALSSVCYSQPKDVLGWQDARWGMSDSDIAATFGIKLQKQRETTLYGYNGTLSYILPGIKLNGQEFSAYFQMAAATDTLKGVYVVLDQRRSQVPREDVFNALESSLTLKYGPPHRKKDERPTKTPIEFVSLSRTWKFPTTTVGLSCQWNSDNSSQVVIHYFPSNLKE